MFSLRRTTVSTVPSSSFSSPAAPSPSSKSAGAAPKGAPKTQPHDHNLLAAQWKAYLEYLFYKLDSCAIAFKDPEKTAQIRRLKMAAKEFNQHFLDQLGNFRSMKTKTRAPQSASDAEPASLLDQLHRLEPISEEDFSVIEKIALATIREQGLPAAHERMTSLFLIPMISEKEGLKDEEALFWAQLGKIFSSASERFMVEDAAQLNVAIQKWNNGEYKRLSVVAQNLKKTSEKPIEDAFDKIKALERFIERVLTDETLKKQFEANKTHGFVARVTNYLDKDLRAKVEEIKRSYGATHEKTMSTLTDLEEEERKTIASHQASQRVRKDLALLNLEEIHVNIRTCFSLGSGGRKIMSEKVSMCQRIIELSEEAQAAPAAVSLAVEAAAPTAAHAEGSTNPSEDVTLGDAAAIQMAEDGDATAFASVAAEGGHGFSDRASPNPSLIMPASQIGGSAPTDEREVEDDVALQALGAPGNISDASRDTPLGLEDTNADTQSNDDTTVLRDSLGSDASGSCPPTSPAAGTMAEAIAEAPAVLEMLEQKKAMAHDGVEQEEKEGLSAEQLAHTVAEYVISSEPAPEPELACEAREATASPEVQKKPEVTALEAQIAQQKKAMEQRRHTRASTVGDSSKAPDKAPETPTPVVAASPPKPLTASVPPPPPPPPAPAAGLFSAPTPRIVPAADTPKATADTPSAVPPSNRSIFLEEIVNRGGKTCGGVKCPSFKAAAAAASGAKGASPKAPAVASKTPPSSASGDLAGDLAAAMNRQISMLQNPPSTSQRTSEIEERKWSTPGDTQSAASFRLPQTPQDKNRSPGSTVCAPGAGSLFAGTAFPGVKLRTAPTPERRATVDSSGGGQSTHCSPGNMNKTPASVAVAGAAKVPESAVPVPEWKLALAQRKRSAAAPR